MASKRKPGRRKVRLAQVMRMLSEPVVSDDDQAVGVAASVSAAVSGQSIGKLWSRCQEASSAQVHSLSRGSRNDQAL